jgi:vancomycin aglycone glucosyltransferase
LRGLLLRSGGCAAAGLRGAELGIGAAHDGPTPTVESLSTVLEPALRDDTNARAKDVSTTIRTDGASVAARKLINLIIRPAD